MDSSTKGSTIAPTPVGAKAAPKAKEPKVDPVASDFKTAEEALKAGIPGDRVAEQFGISKQDAQILRLDLGLIKPGAMHDYWTRMKAKRSEKAAGPGKTEAFKDQVADAKTKQPAPRKRTAATPDHKAKRAPRRVA